MHDEERQAAQILSSEHALPDVPFSSPDNGARVEQGRRQRRFQQRHQSRRWEPWPKNEDREKAPSKQGHGEVGRLPERRGLVEGRTAQEPTQEACMNVRAKCINEGCEAYNVEKSVAVGTLTGYGAGNGRVKCPKCGQLMQTTKTIATTARGARKPGTRQSPGRGGSRS